MEGVNLPAHLRDRLATLAPQGGKLLVGVSGGADSVALLRGLAEAGFDLAVAHLDHRLRPESADDAGFVAELAASLGLEARVERVDVARVANERGWNIEDAARRVRYEFLTRTARDLGIKAVAIGHTLDDQAETVLMQLLRGAAYLRGMTERRGMVVRPLLDVPRSRLRDYLAGLEQPWREDPTNRDRSRLRSWLRHEILPGLLDRFPDVATRLGHHAVLQSDVEDFVRSGARRMLRAGGSAADADGFFDRGDLAAAAPALQREAIRFLFEAAAVAPAFERIEEVRRQLGRETPYRLTLAPTLTLRLAYGRLELARQAHPPADRSVVGPAELPPGVPASVLDLVEEHGELRLRGRLPGDRMRLPGGSKSLARLLIDRKVPREERDALEVLASGSRVLWAEGIGLAADVPAESGFDNAPDWRFMRRALALAEAGARAGELPVGAVLVRDGEIVGEAHNETETSGDPTAHAEVLAMRRAAVTLSDWRLSRCTLYVTLEPCPMCAGAAIESHLERIVFGASNLRDGALGSVADLLALRWKRRVQVRSGVLAREAGRLLNDFFAERRRP